ncbi:PREDICTED: protein toll-like [Polistes dominula]|uniref:Protein toll-like n=1 Tax=Polistes dominula TaxID=743375 RepID=A0ABM1HSS6_POLDO|nr:PREDICTED: protein toll-like [Polistes dominula]
MIIRILIIFLITFTSINGAKQTLYAPCENNPSCDCLSFSKNDLNINCSINASAKFFISIKSSKNVKIICSNQSSWEHFYIKTDICDKVLESLSFERCRLPNDISLKEVLKQFAIKDTYMLEFQSYQNLFGTLEREHLEGFRSVQTLILSKNGLTNIPNNLFWDFPYLEYIDLSNNKLDLPVDIFHNLLTSLKSDIFYELTNLEKLDISMNNFSSIPANLFEKTTALKDLTLYSNNNKLDTLPDYLLANLTKLYQVYLNDNGLKFLPENLFLGSTSLMYIFLYDNLLVTLPINIFRDLHLMKQLSLKNNRIEYLPDKIFEDMEELKVLDLSDNQLTYLSRYIFYGLIDLETLNIERNQIEDIDLMAFHPLISLKFVNLSHNPLRLTHISKKMSGSIFTVPSLDTTIDLSYNKIRHIDLSNIEEKVSWRMEDRYMTIDFKHNPLLCDCALYNLLRYREYQMRYDIYDRYNFIIDDLTCIQPDGKNEIKISDLESKEYTCFERDYYNSVQLCQKGCTCRIRPLDETRIVDCSYRNLSTFLIDEMRMILRRQNPVIFNLTGNFLTEIPSTKTSFPIKVTGLMLSNNNITRIAVVELPSTIEILELQNNNITRIDFRASHYLSSVKWKKLTLSGIQLIVCIVVYYNRKYIRLWLARRGLDYGVYFTAREVQE